MGIGRYLSLQLLSGKWEIGGFREELVILTEDVAAATDESKLSRFAGVSEA
jgi:hypothetical protein